MAHLQLTTATTAHYIYSGSLISKEYPHNEIMAEGYFTIHLPALTNSQSLFDNVSAILMIDQPCINHRDYPRFENNIEFYAGLLSIKIFRYFKTHQQLLDTVSHCC